jgi:hypothetical protein
MEEESESFLYTDGGQVGSARLTRGDAHRVEISTF